MPMALPLADWWFVGAMQRFGKRITAVVMAGEPARHVRIEIPR